MGYDPKALVALLLDSRNNKSLGVRDSGILRSEWHDTDNRTVGNNSSTAKPCRPSISRICSRFALRVAHRHQIVQSALAMLKAPLDQRDFDEEIDLTSQTGARKEIGSGAKQTHHPDVSPMVLSLADAAWLCEVGCGTELAMADSGELLRLIDIADRRAGLRHKTGSRSKRPNLLVIFSHCVKPHFEYLPVQSLRLRALLTSPTALALHRDWLINAVDVDDDEGRQEDIAYNITKNNSTRKPTERNTNEKLKLFSQHTHSNDSSSNQDDFSDSDDSVYIIADPEPAHGRKQSIIARAFDSDGENRSFGNDVSNMASSTSKDGLAYRSSSHLQYYDLLQPTSLVDSDVDAALETLVQWCGFIVINDDDVNKIASWRDTLSSYVPNDGSRSELSTIGIDNDDDSTQISKQLVPKPCSRDQAETLIALLIRVVHAIV